jgi:hypothetical protein
MAPTTGLDELFEGWQAAIGLERSCPMAQNVQYSDQIILGRIASPG